jgi:hypothetical protein
LKARGQVFILDNLVSIHKSRVSFQKHLPNDSSRKDAKNAKIIGIIKASLKAL